MKDARDSLVILMELWELIVMLERVPIDYLRTYFGFKQVSQIQVTPSGLYNY